MPDDTMNNEDAMADTERTPKTSALQALADTLEGLGHDELRVIARIAERLQTGAKHYGRLDLLTDTRAFRAKEAREEVEDALVYLACAWLKEVAA